MVNAKLDFDPIDQFLWARLVYANSFNTGNEDRFEPGGYLTDYWTDESIKVIKANKNRPYVVTQKGEPMSGLRHNRFRLKLSVWWCQCGGCRWQQGMA